MIVEPIEQDNDKPFVKITFTRKEAEILRKLVEWNIETLIVPTRTSSDPIVNISGSNEMFALPLFNKLSKLLGEQND